MKAPSPLRSAGALQRTQASPLVGREFPAELTPLLETALDTAADWLARNEPAEFREPLLELASG